MCDIEVGNVMTREVITVLPDTPFRELVGLMLAHGIGALVVIDIAGRPVGIITENDLLAKMEFHNRADPAPLLAGARHRGRWRKSSASVAAELMNPPVTMTLGTPLTIAIHALAEHDGPLTVTDNNGWLIGILTRANALRLFIRADNAIKTDVLQDLAHLARENLHIDVAAGIVQLSGELPFRSLAERIADAARRVPGVIAVRNNLTYLTDDLAITGL